ncbi:hypothetical protein D3C73_1096840 [compost metagenome]
MGPGIASRLRGVVSVGSKEGSRVVAPVIGHAQVLEVGLIQVEMNGQKLDGRDAQFSEVLDHHRMRHARVGPAEVLRDVRVQHGLATNVCLIDHRGAHGRSWRAVVAPIKACIHVDACEELAPLVHGAAVRIEQQWLAAVVVQVHSRDGQRKPALTGGLTEAIAGARRHAVDEAEVDAVLNVGQNVGLPRFAGCLEHHLHAVQIRCEDGHVHRIVGCGLGVENSGLGRAQSEGPGLRRIQGSCCVKNRHNHCLQV